MNELYHHGILGQKWGRRRWQNDDGTYNEAGKKRYFGSSENKKSDTLDNKRETRYNKAVDNLSKSYQSRGLSKEEADEAARKRKELEKRLLVGVGVAAAAGLTIYAAKKMGRDYVDKTIKAGTTIQTLSDDPDRLHNGKAFYTAFKKGDKKKYLGEFSTIPETGQYKLNINAKASKDIKIASPKKAEKIFNNLLSNDKDFRDKFKKTEADREVAEMFNPVKSKSSYDSFNRFTLIGNDSMDSSLQNKFYKALSNKGYGGVLDVNDAKYSGFNTKAAIIFDNESFMNQSISKITDDQVKSGKKYFYLATAKDALTHPLGMTSIAAFAGDRAIKKHDKKVNKTIENKQKEEKKAKMNGNT